MKNSRGIRILGIETSCDETAISLIEVSNDGKTLDILGNTVHSQIDMHAPHGGVFPMLAKREHQINLVPVLVKTLGEAEEETEKTKKRENTKITREDKKALLDEIFAREPELRANFDKVLPALKKPEIDFISVTYGPGLEPALWVGIAFARALACLWDIPIIPCNHMEGHILTGLIKKQPTPASYLLTPPPFPALSLLISGGHTQIVLTEKIGSYKIIGETLDDAIGECFDKVARMLGLAYPGGPKISKLAAEARVEGLQSPEPLPRPMISSKDLNFSFSGLKTAVLYLVKKLKDNGIEMNDSIRKAISCEVENAITDVIIAKMRKAIELCAVESIIIGGGVIANTHIRQALEKLAADCSISILLPQTDHSTDNGLMIALAGYFNQEKALPAATFIKAMGTLPLGPRI